jgi:hypothetical protein
MGILYIPFIPCHAIHIHQLFHLATLITNQEVISIIFIIKEFAQSHGICLFLVSRMLSRLALVLCLALVAPIHADIDDKDRRRGGHSGGHGGGHSGGSGSRTCFIVDAGTTTCTGASGVSCSDSANLAVSSIPGLPDFLWYNIAKQGKIYQMAVK